MKKLILIILPLLIFSCKNPAASLVVTEAEATNFDWLLGNWRRTNEQEDRETFESWSKKNKTEYHGLGYTLQNNDTIWKETINLVELNGIWRFEVAGKGETKPTVFKLTKFGKEEFICENPENEFPKLIQYYKEADNLKAMITDEEMKISFNFEKIHSLEKK